MTFDEFKQININACRKRHACTKGYADLLKADSVTAILRVWRTYWNDLYNVLYFDDIKENVNDAYESMKDDFQLAGIFVNEPSNKAIVIANNCEEPLRVDGKCKVYIFGASRVIAKGNAGVYCHTEGSIIELAGNSYASVSKGKVFARERSEAVTKCEAECYGAATITAFGGIVTDYGHRVIEAYADTIVYSNTNRRISLFDNAKILPLKKEE